MEKKTDKKNFLEFPAVEYCTTVMSFGPPRSGKTYIALECMKAWIEMGMFEKYICILPSFRNEMSGSYDWMMKHENVTVYESFHNDLMQKVLDEQFAKNKEVKAGKLPEMPRVFVFIDDATSQGKDMFESGALIKMATQNRHYAIHTWIALHYDKGIVPPKVRQNINFLFIYPVKTDLLKKIHKEYVPAKFKELDDFKKQFLPYWSQNVEQHEYPCLLIGPDSYNADCSTWFSKE